MKITHFAICMTSLLAVCHCITPQAFAQPISIDAGLLGGATYYSGEIDPQRWAALPGRMHPAAGAFLRLHASPRIALRLSYLQGTVSADDARATDPEIINRNLHFRSVLQETAVQLEYDFTEIGGWEPQFFAPFIIGGAAVFHFNPEAQYQGEWWELQPLHTEGQGSEAYPDRQPYARTAVSFPMGAGIKCFLSPRLSLTAEWSMRYTLTDYLDDVSTTYPFFTLEDGEPSLSAIFSDRILTDHYFEPGSSHSRGNPKTKDWYYYGGISLSWRLGKMRSAEKYRFGRKVKCYSF